MKETSKTTEVIFPSLFSPVIRLGEHGISFFENLYGITHLQLQVITNFSKVWFYRRQIIEQFHFIGIGSIPLIFVVSAFTGMVTAVQAGYQMSPFVPKYIVGALILQSVVLELGPVLTALVMAGRVGAGIAAEIGTMKVSEQVDALESLALDPVGYLAMPRFLAGLIMIPVLTIFSDFIAILAGYTIAINTIGLSSQEFVKGMMEYFFFHDIVVGLTKSVCFGGIITIVGSYMGLTAKNGAKGVGSATTISVVASAVLILVFDYIVAQVFL